MNTNELMIGDWVYNKHHKKNIQITPYDFFIHGHLPSGRQYFINKPELVSGRDLEPIPLTREILEKNGMKFRTNVGWFAEDEEYFLEISTKGDNVYWTINDWEYSLLKLNYVHELQHALKLCRIEKEIVL